MRVRSVAAALAITATAAACAADPDAVTEADYLLELQAICADTTSTFDALPEPPDEIPVAAFASNAASAIANEAERVRALEFPDSVADDHRAFIGNTDEQSSAWRAIAVAGDDELGELAVRVGELIRGRNDLAVAMGAPDCRRGEV